MQITKKKRFIYKPLKEFKINDEVFSFDKNPKVVSIQKNGQQEVYKVSLSNGTSFRCGESHLTTVCFRKKNNKECYDTLTAKWMKENISKYNFRIINDPKKLEVEQTIQLTVEHENEPDNSIIPLEKDENHTYISSIEDLNYKEEQWCLTLNDPLGLYRTAHGIYTHNSTFTMLALLYVAASYALMRDPWKFFNKSKTTIFAICLCAVTLTKAKEIYEEPIRQLIESADFWHFCRTHKEMLDAEAELAESDTVEYIPWSNGGPQPLDSKIYLPDGSYKLMGDIKIGDEIASPTTEKCTVIDIPYKNENDICYEIELDDGRKCKCAANHKWKVAWEKDCNGNWLWKIVAIEFIVSHPELEFEIFEGPFTEDIKKRHLSKEQNN